MKRIFFLLIISLIFASPAQAGFFNIGFDLDDLIASGKKEVKEKFKLDSLLAPKYAEDSGDALKINKGGANRNFPRGQFYIEGYDALSKDRQMAISAALDASHAVNKFVAGAGVLDITWQVKRGTEMAIKDSLRGVPEYQRRLTAQEYINSSFKTYSQSSIFLLSSLDPQASIGNTTSEILEDELRNVPVVGKALTEVLNMISSQLPKLPFIGEFIESRLETDQSPNLLNLSYRLLERPFVEEITEATKLIASSLLFCMLVLTLFSRSQHMNANFDYAISEPLIRYIGSFIFLFFAIKIPNFFLWLFTSLNIKILTVLFSHQQLFENTMSLFESVQESWINLANDTGYLPAMVLSVLSILSQVIFYIYTSGLILQVLIGKIASPLAIVALNNSNTSGAAANFIVSWLKALASLALIPLSYALYTMTALEFMKFNMPFLDIILSTAVFILIPWAGGTILGKTNAISAATGISSYQVLVDTVRSGFYSLESFMVSHSSNQFSSETNKDEINSIELMTKTTLDQHKQNLDQALARTKQSFRDSMREYSLKQGVYL